MTFSYEKKIPSDCVVTEIAKFISPEIILQILLPVFLLDTDKKTHFPDLCAGDHVNLFK